MAIKNSFKQQCPSCEAMVPIRDTGLIGRKIDCPKCKYRFVVEEPAEAEEEEEAPSGKAKKTKPATTGVTNKKPANGKAVKAGAKPAPKRRGDDDDDDDEEDVKPKKKKNGGGSGILIIGLGLGAVAVVALAVGAYFLFAGGEKKKPSNSPGAMANAPPTGGPGGAGGEVKKEDKPKDVKPVLTDATNLLPNDSQRVIHLPVERLLANPTFKKAALMTAGSFNEVSFQRTWGISPTDVTQVVMGLNPEKKTVFSVMRTEKPLKEEQIVAALRLKAEPAIGTMNYYLLQKPLDSLSTFLLKANAGRDKIALHFLDRYTVVCADLEPMQEFLKEKGHPKHLSEPPAPPAEQPKSGRPGMGGTPGGGMAGGPPGGAKPPGAQPGSAGAPPAPGGGQPGAGAKPPGAPAGPAGGFQPPSGLPPGMRPPGSRGGSNSEATPVSSSYLTIDPHLKAVLDQVEKIDKKEGQVLLLSFAQQTSLLTVDNVKKQRHAGQFDVSRLTDFSISQADLDKFKKEIKTIGKGLTELSESKYSETRALYARDEKIVPSVQKRVLAELEKEFAADKLNMLSKAPTGRGNFPGMGPGMPMPPGMGPGGPMPPGMQPGGPMPPGMRSPGGDEEKKEEEKGKDGDYLMWAKDNVVAVSINRNMQAQQVLTQPLEEVCKKFRADADMCDDRSRIHELAAATQEYLKKEGHFPRGAVPRAPSADRVIDWRPDQRLSWMVELLPYIGNGEFKSLRKHIEDASSWNDPSKNLFAAATVIPQYLAPLPANKREGYYIPYPGLKDQPLAATHFVGVAGVGLDAAEYRAGDAARAKQCGIFGYDRETKPDDIKDGLAETILLLQVPPEPKSPWMAGGGSTVRGVSTDLDCVRPFVCAKYQGKDGTFAIMADGKVRFIAERIDAKIFQAMCTIAGGEKIKDLDAVAPEVPVPEDFQQPELKAEQPALPVAQPPAGQTPSPKTPAGWTDFTSKEGGFTVRLPAGKVKEENKQVKLPAGPLTIHMYGIELPGDAGGFAVVTSDYPPAVMASSADNIFEGVKVGLPAGMGKGAKITHESKINVEGRPGREWTIDIPGQGNMKVRVFFVKNRMFQLMAGGSPDKVPATDVQAFFDSFRLAK